MHSMGEGHAHERDDVIASNDRQATHETAAFIAKGHAEGHARELGKRQETNEMEAEAFKFA